MSRRARQAPDQPSLLEAAAKTAPCVPAIREAVRGWVGSGYKGAFSKKTGFSGRKR
jgi:hypothetical protein